MSIIPFPVSTESPNGCCIIYVHQTLCKPVAEICAVHDKDVFATLLRHGRVQEGPGQRQERSHIDGRRRFSRIRGSHLQGSGWLLETIPGIIYAKKKLHGSAKLSCSLGSTARHPGGLCERPLARLGVLPLSARGHGYQVSQPRAHSHRRVRGSSQVSEPHPCRDLT